MLIKFWQRLLDLQHRQVWQLALPMILSNLTVPLVGMVDTAVVAHLEEEQHLGAVSLGAALFGIIFWGFGFLRMGTTALAAQALGRAEQTELTALLVRAVLLSLVLAVLLMLLSPWVGQLSFWIFQASDKVETLAGHYYEIRILSSPATLLNYVLMGWFLGIHRPRYSLYLVLVINLSNIVLDLYFVQVLGLGSAGVAWASLCAEYLGAVCGVMFCLRLLPVMPWKLPAKQLFDSRRFKSLLVMNQNIFVRTLSLMFVLAFFTAQGARFGDLTLAANAVLFNFQTFLSFGLDGFAHAVEALVGRHQGARDRQAMRDAIFSAGFWALLCGLLYMLVYSLLGRGVVDLLTSIESVRAQAYEYLFWVALLPILSVWSFMLDGIFIGMLWTRQMRNSMLLSVFVVFLPVWYLSLVWGNHGLWFAFCCFMLARAIFMLLMLKGGKHHLRIA